MNCFLCVSVSVLDDILDKFQVDFRAIRTKGPRTDGENDKEVRIWSGGEIKKH